jgi:LacI family transcriptional regulator
MTVSRVFRNSTNVAPATRTLVQAVAARLGYRPDPQVAQLMERVRSRRTRHVQSVLAVIRDDLPDDVLHGETYNYVQLEDIRRRALQHGYEIEEFGLGRGGISPKRLRNILQTRGIGGLLISVQSSRQLSAQIDYTGFAAATFGYGLTAPKLHQTSTNMTQGILTATALLESRGYRRIGLAISPWIDARADHTYSGAMLYYQQKVPAKYRVAPLLFPENDLSRGELHFRKWMRKHKPDAVISFHRMVPDWLREGLGLRIPQDVAFVVHDWVPTMTGFAGIDHQRDQVAAAAVDLVATQLQHNETSVPDSPRQVLISPRFVDGPSIRGIK